MGDIRRKVKTDEVRSLCKEDGVSYVTFNNDAHFRLAGVVDYWPQTNKWWLIGTTEKGYGIVDAVVRAKQRLKVARSLPKVTGELLDGFGDGKEQSESLKSIIKRANEFHDEMMAERRRESAFCDLCKGKDLYDMSKEELVSCVLFLVRQLKDSSHE